MRLKMEYKWKSAFENWNTLVMCKERPNVSRMLSQKSSHIYCSPELFRKKDKQSSTVMEFCREPALFHFNSKPSRQQIFNLGTTPESPLNLTVSPIPMVSIWTEGSGNAWSYYPSGWDNHDRKAKGKMTYFIWTLWEALARDATRTQDYLVTQALGHHTAPSPSQSLSQSVLYSLYSGSVYWGLSLNWAWDRGHGMIEQWIR